MLNVVLKCHNNPAEKHLLHQAYSPAVKVCSLLPIELTPDCATVFSGAESLEAIIDQLGILFVEVLMGHDI